jgi:REP element-mobilizing transposase RayT
MSYTYRHLPHWIPEDVAVFVTWRLAGSLPLRRGSEWDRPSPFVACLSSHDNQLDHPHSGPVWLQDPRIAEVVASALLHGESGRRFYTLHAWVIMPNHVHAIFEPHAAMPTIMHWLKSRTARVANQILGRTGASFWQDESFDHWVRSTDELDALIEYVETNPVKAGLAQSKDRWQWSSASGTGHRLLRPVSVRTTTRHDS